MNAIFVRMQVKCMSAVESLKARAGRSGAVGRRLGKDERAASVIEYAILLGVIVGAVTVAVGTFGNQIETVLTDIAARVTTTTANVGNS